MLPEPDVRQAPVEHTQLGAPELSHRQLLDGEFWRAVAGYREIDRARFLDHRFQAKHSVTSAQALLQVLGREPFDGFFAQLQAGLARATMRMRLTPYLVSLIDWRRAPDDPLRRQFLPLLSEQQPDHPMARLDSLSERAHSPLPGVTHRYADRVLLVTQDRCPAYCRFCTRSYAVGGDAGGLRKLPVSAQPERLARGLAYIEAHPEVEDVLVSGGDCYALRADQLTAIGQGLLSIGHVRRIRFATKGPVVAPMKLLTDEPWTQALIAVAQRGRRLRKEVVVHTHFNHPREITAITAEAIGRLFEAGLTTRNQGVLLRGVNDDPDVLRMLVKRLGHVNVQSMYMFQHDFVPGVEDLRTPLSAALELEKQVRGHTAGYNTPAFAVDLPGGGGKRDVHSFEHYDRDTGISVYRSPNMHPTARYLYFDPLHSLTPDAQERWQQPRARKAMIEAATNA